MSLGETAELAVRLKLDSAGYDRALSSASKATSNFGKTASKIGGDVSKGFGNAIHNLEKMAVVAGGFATGAAVAAVKWAGDFEAQLNTINTVAMATPAELSKIGDGIRDVAKKTGLSLDDLTQGYYDLVSAGIKAKDAQAILNDAVTLGIGGLATTAETVDLLTSAINSYGLTVPQAAKATDAFAQAVADGKVTASQIAATFADIAPLAKNSGISINEIAAAFAFLTAKGVPAAEVTTQMKRALIELLKPNQNLIDLQKKVGENFANTAKQKGLNVALNDLAKAAKANGIPLTDLFSRVEGLQYVLQTTGKNAAGFATELDKIANSSGEAAAQMAERQKGLNNALAILKANIKDAGITIGAALIPQLVDLSKEATNFLQGHQGDIKTFGVNLAKAFRDAVTWAKTLDWKAIGDGLKTAANAAKGVMDAFMAAPTWLKEAVITGWGLNKLTGGALSNIGGDIAKGIGNQLFTRGSSPANPMWVQQAGGLGGAAGGSGLLGKAASAIAIVGVVALAAETEMTIIQGFADANKQLADRGLSPAEIAAFKYQNGTQAFRDAADKHGYGQFSPSTAPTSGGMSPDERQAMHDAAQKLQDVKDASQGTAREIIAMGKSAVAVAHSNNALSKDHSWLEKLAAGIHDRSVKKFGGKGLGSAAESATYQRDVLGRAASIEKSSASAATKLERMKALLHDAKLATDKTKTVLSGDIKGLKAAVAKQKPPSVTVNVGTNVQVSANAVVAKYQSTRSYGPSDPQHKHTGIYETNP